MDQRENINREETPQKSFIETPPIWGRFAKARTAVLDALSDQTDPSINIHFREQRFYNNYEFQDGYYGRLDGLKNNIDLSIDIKGSSIEEIPPYYGYGERDLNSYRNRDLNIKTASMFNPNEEVSITGYFISRDGKQGSLAITLYKGKAREEAYWLECGIGNQRYLRLEQIVNSKEVIDVGDLDIGTQIKFDPVRQRRTLGKRKVTTVEIIKKYDDFQIRKPFLENIHSLSH